MTLRDILAVYSDNPLPDTWKSHDNRKPDSVYKVLLAFMSEDETHILAYATHPLLIPWYDCPVLAIDTPEAEVLRIWLKYEDWIKTKIPEWRGG